ncbi:MaoC family dehydratase [Polaribacter batillariae]|uniref:MaoC family dehydratase n=1 Tax=Polaribacter batillariae TaxID=2808900 RepID=A0ABX7SXH2_9FLAO|nr:MaoC family dehydratase [Polaribacter batillariae]QTD38013.1 MaoC family dehydratase [Polaribacter batillariae]
MKPLVFENLKEFTTMVGKQLPTGNWYTVTQEMINDFANATLDKQWIHIDKERAKKESPFKSTIAHGFMSVAMISKLLEGLFVIKSVKMGLNYGLNKVRFPNPVPVNSLLRMLAEVKEIETLDNNGIKITFSCLIEINGQEKPACVAEFLCVLYE